MPLTLNKKSHHLSFTILTRADCCGGAVDITKVILPVVMASENVTTLHFSRNKKKIVFMVENNLLSIISHAFHLYY